MSQVASHPKRALLELQEVALRFGGVNALNGVSLAVSEGELLSVIGPNGAGKTSLLNCISGRYRPTDGRVLFDGKDITTLAPHRRAALGIGRTFQNLALFGHMTVLDNILVGRHHLLGYGFFTAPLYWLGGVRTTELQHRCRVEEIIDF